MGGWITNGGSIIAAGNTYSELLPNALIPADTGASGGVPPQTVAATAWQVAALAAGMVTNSGTSSAAACTLNVHDGYVLTESLTTSAGGTYSFVLTDSLVTSGGTVTTAMYPGTNTTGGPMALTSATLGTGSATFVFTNQGTAALNGKMVIPFHVA